MKYKLIEASTEDGTPIWWIMYKESYCFGLLERTKLRGKYKIGTELGDMPFFSKEDAEKEINKLNSI